MPIFRYDKKPRPIIWIYRIRKNDQWLTLLSRLSLDGLRTSYTPSEIVIIGEINPSYHEITIF